MVNNRQELTSKLLALRSLMTDALKLSRDVRDAAQDDRCLYAESDVVDFALMAASGSINTAINYLNDGKERICQTK